MKFEGARNHFTSDVLLPSRSLLLKLPKKYCNTLSGHVTVKLVFVA